MQITIRQVQNEPLLSVDSAIDTDKLYTVIMTDPDAKDRIKHEKREWVHFVAINCPVTENKKAKKYVFDTKNGEILIEFVRSKPPKDTGLHRYVFLVYQQTKKIDINNCNQPKLGVKGKGRALWSAKKFAATSPCNKLIAGNFFQAKHDGFKK